MAFGDGRCMIMDRDVLGYGNGVSSNGDLLLPLRVLSYSAIFIHKY